LGREKDKVLVVVDQYGQHAGSAGKLLSSEGYDVRRLSGGMVEWRGQNLPVVKGS
jgi:rhodanese-related sulfurtransferase